MMKEVSLEEEDISIQWTKKDAHKYIVKFDKISTPIVMNDIFYKTIMHNLRAEQAQ